MSPVRRLMIFIALVGVLAVLSEVMIELGYCAVVPAAAVHHTSKLVLVGTQAVAPAAARDVYDRLHGLLSAGPAMERAPPIAGGEAHGAPGWGPGKPCLAPGDGPGKPRQGRSEREATIRSEAGLPSFNDHRRGVANALGSPAS